MSTFDDGYRLALAERHPVLVERVGRLPAPSVRASAEPAKVVTYQGLTVHVDRPIGTVQQGTDEDGQPWSRTYSCDYGYLPRTTGGDGEELDVFLGTDPDATKAHWVVQQKNDGAFDELKLLLGFPSADEARAAYLAHVPEKHLRSLETTSIAQVRALCGVEPGLKAAPAPTTKDAPMESHADAPDLRSAAHAATDPGQPVSRPRGLCVREAFVSALREDEREIDFVCSTETVDSYGEIVRQTWDLTRFERNPVALFGHDSHALPIGQWKNTRVDGGALRSTLKIASEKANPLAENVFHSLKEGSLRTVSVGFLPGKVSFEEIDGKEVCVLDDNTLFEISVVPIPANPDAIAERKARAKAAFVERIAAPPPDLTALGAVPYEEYPPVDAGAWDSASTIMRLRRWASSDGSGSADHVDWTKYRKAFGWMDPQRSHEFGGFKLPHHDVKDGKLVTVRAGVIAAGNALSGSRGGVKIPAGDVAAVQKHLQRHYHQFGLRAPWEPEPADNTKTTSPTRALREPPMSDKAMITCPHCGDSFDPNEPDADDKSKKTLGAYVQRHTAPLEDRAKGAETKLTKAEADLAEVRAAKATAETERDAFRDKLFEAELAPLVGVKIEPAEREGQLLIAKHFATQGEAGSAKWKSHVEALSKRADLATKPGGSVLGADPSTEQRGAGDPDSEALALVSEFQRGAAA